MSIPLPFLTVVNSTVSNGWDSAPNGALNLINVSEAGDNYGHINTNLSDTRIYVQGWELADMPSAFGSMASLSIQLNYGWSIYAN